MRQGVGGGCTRQPLGRVHPEIKIAGSYPAHSNKIMMKASYKFFTGAVLAFTMGVLGAGTAAAQFTITWIDIGDYQDGYSQVGVKNESSNLMAYPAIHRNSAHERSGAFWIGAKNWTDPNGQAYPYYTSRIGPRDPGVDFAYPLEDKLVAKWEDSEVTVDGVASFDRVAVVSEVDPSLAADRMQESIWNMNIGVTVRKRAYAYSNGFHDEYHIVEYLFTNTGNTDDDPEIELDGQTLDETYFYWIHRWRGGLDGAWVGDGGQVWGKYSMVDAVGDGHADYPLDITAYYLWKGYEPDFDASKWDNLGAPLIEAGRRFAQGDTVGRLSGAYFDGEMPVYAPNSMSDASFDRSIQPHTIGFMDQDEKLTAAGAAHSEYYEDGILTREDHTAAPAGCSSDVTRTRMCPMWADRIEPDGNFWAPTNNPSQGRQGGHAATAAYGPYDMAFGDEVRIVFVRSVGALDFDAALVVGREYSLTGWDRDRVIRYDANGDGVIKDDVPYSFHDVYDLGLEAMTKNQWVLTARDSLFKNFLKGKAVYEASNDFTAYPIVQPPLPPRTFSVAGKPGEVELSWEPLSGGPARVGWEVYRTSRGTFWSPAYDYVRDSGSDGLLGALSSTDQNVMNKRLRRTEDELPYTCVRGARPDCKAPMLDAGATSFSDTDVVRGEDYYYYLVAVGENLPNDPNGLRGVPGGGVPLRSGRYFTQTYQPANLKRPPFGATGTIEDVRVVPNPVNLGSDQSIRFTKEDEVAFFNIPGDCTIKIYSEIGELIQTIEHADGSGDEKWNLTTSARQLLVSGIYIAVVTDNETNEQVFRKFTVIR